MNEEFLKLYTSAFHFGCETTLRKIIEALGISNSGMVLEQADIARQILAQYKLEVVPGLTAGDLDSNRILRNKERKVVSAENLQLEINNGEGPSLEFKETLIFDVKRSLANPGTPIDQLRSAEVLHSALKTIAALLSCGGGTLYVGVTDAGVLEGIEKDFPLLKKADSDAWETELRTNIGGKFKDGNTINDYVKLDCVVIGGVTIARIQVQGRQRLTCIRDKTNRFILYRRQGNRSVEVSMDEVEEFIQFRTQKNWC